MGVLTSRFANVWCQMDTNMSNFHPLEVVCRGSETQLQVGENLNMITNRATRHIPASKTR